MAVCSTHVINVFSPVISRVARPRLSRNKTRSKFACCSAQPKLAVAGSANVDLVLTIPRLPLTGETLSASSQTFPGGKVCPNSLLVPPPPANLRTLVEITQGANQAVAAARLACATSFIGQVGRDANAGVLREALGGAGVNLEHLKVVEGPSGSALILLQPGGENSIIIVGGANTAKWLISDETQEAIRSCGMLLLQREVPDHVNLQLAQIAKTADVPVLLDCGGMEGPLGEELLQCLSILSPNETELARLTGLPTSNEEELHAAAKAVLSQGVPAVLLKCGSRGSLLLTAEGFTHSEPACSVEEVVDTTGAGDCFTAAFAVRILEGASQPEAMRFAGAAASLCIQKSGAQPSMPSRQDVEQLLSRLKS